MYVQYCKSGYIIAYERKTEINCGGLKQGCRYKIFVNIYLNFLIIVNNFIFLYIYLNNNYFRFIKSYYMSIEKWGMTNDFTVII